MVAGAGWEASYDVRVAVDNTLQLTYYGNVRQETGEVCSSRPPSSSRAPVCSGPV